MDEHYGPNHERPVKDVSPYIGLPRLLYGVRWTQHLLSIVAEVLILLSFAMSGMDVSLGGVMASVPLLKILWAGMFALGIDTAFALSWVRVRQYAQTLHWWALSWNLLLALGMSVIVFQPIAIQLLQQSLNVDFTQAVDSLGINIVFLTYARAGVAVFLGAIMAVTNEERGMVQERQPSLSRRRIAFFDDLLNRIAPVVTEEQKTPELPNPSINISELPTHKLPIVVPPEPKQPLIGEQAPSQPPSTVEQSVERSETTAEERQARVREFDLASLSTAERVKKVLELFPNVPDRELGRLSGVSAATAKKYRCH